MAGGNSIGDHCSYNALKQCTSRIICDGQSLSLFHNNMRHTLWLVNALLVASAILAGVIVGMGVFGKRYRYHRLTRFIFVGATTLFLPVMSSIVPLATESMAYVIDTEEGQLAAKCYPGVQSRIVIIWASLVQIITINTSAIVAVDDREGRNIGPPFELLVQGFWTYLGVTYFTNGGINSREELIEFVVLVIGLEGIPFGLVCAKMVFKYYAFKKAQQSFALGNNPHLIFAYMQQPPPVQAGTSHLIEAAVVNDQDAPPPPPLLVMGEGKRHMDKQFDGYVWKGDSGTSMHGKDGLVTIDSVWTMTACFFPFSTLRRLQDLCLSFAFFKLLRCRFARYNVNTTNASSDMSTFFWSLLLKDGGHNRVFQIILEEISFVNDYYYSSIPITYSKCWLPIMGIFISLLSIAYCIVAVTLLIFLLANEHASLPQLWCRLTCTENQLQRRMDPKYYGSWLFGLVPLLFLLVLVFTTEVRDMAKYICSNWTKVGLMCRLLNRASSASTSKHSLCIQKCASLLLRCRCKLLRRHWYEKIGQCSVLVFQLRATPLGLLWYLCPLFPDQNRKVRVPAAVKVCIIRALRRTRGDGGQLSNGAACLRHLGQIGEIFLWACSNKCASYTILTWHIATSIHEVTYPHILQDQKEDSLQLSNTDYKMVATHLSRYCAYLVTWCPELLPDDHEWSRNLYKDVKKDARRVLAGCTAGDLLTPEAKCQQLVELLSTKAKHQVVKDGARLGKELVEVVLQGGDDTAWKLLAEFWLEMILYVAPSDNLQGHKEAIARGGELITLLWVLLFHAGIVNRPVEVDKNAAGVV